jgi:hypothetical protein
MTLSAKGSEKLVVFQETECRTIECDRRATIHDEDALGIKCETEVIKSDYKTQSNKGKKQLINRVVALIKIVISKHSCILPGFRLLFMGHTPLITFFIV